MCVCFSSPRDPRALFVLSHYSLWSVTIGKSVTHVPLTICQTIKLPFSRYGSMNIRKRGREREQNTKQKHNRTGLNMTILKWFEKFNTEKNPYTRTRKYEIGCTDATLTKWKTHQFHGGGIEKTISAKKWKVIWKYWKTIKQSTICIIRTKGQRWKHQCNTLKDIYVFIPSL